MRQCRAIERGGSRVPIPVKLTRARIDSRLRWIAVTGLVACAIWMAFGMINDARFPERYDGYRFRNTEPADWSYPTEAVARWVATIMIEALVGAVFLVWGSKGSPAWRCLAIGFLSGCVGLFLGMMAMHAPLPFGLHAIWLIFAGGWLLLMAVVSVIARIVVRDRPAETEVAEPPTTGRRTCSRSIS